MAEEPPEVPPESAFARLGEAAWRHPAAVEGLVLADDDRCVASCGGQLTRLWDLRTGELKAEFRNWADTITVSADGTHIATGGIDVDLCDVRSAEHLVEVERPSSDDWPCFACYLPERGELVGTTYEKNLVRWGVPGGKIIQRRRFGRARALVVHADILIALLDSEQLSFCEVSTLEELATWSDEAMGDPRAIAWRSAPRPALAVGSNKGMVKLLDPNDGSELRSVEPAVEGREVTSLAFGRGGELLAAGTEDGTIRLWDLADESHTDLRPSSVPVKALALAQDGELLVAAIGSTIRRWRVGPPHRALDQDPGHLGAIDQLSFHQGGHRLATLAADGARVWSLPDLELRHQLPGRTGIGWAADVRLLVLGPADGDSAAVELVDDDGATTRLAAVPSEATESDAHPRFSPDGDVLAWRQWRTIARAELRSDGERTLRELVAGESLLSMEWAPDGRGLASGHYDGEVRLWDAGSGRQRSIAAHKRRAEGLAFAPDGTVLATVSTFYEDAHLCLWNAASRDRIARRKVGEQKIVSWSPDARMLAVAGQDTVSLRETRRLEELMVLRTGNSPVSAVGFAPGGRLLVAGSTDGTLLLWNLEGLLGVVDRCAELCEWLHVRSERGAAGPYRTGPMSSQERAQILYDPGGGACLVLADGGVATRLELALRQGGYSVRLTDVSAQPADARLISPLWLRSAVAETPGFFTRVGQWLRRVFSGGGAASVPAAATVPPWAAETGKRVGAVDVAGELTDGALTLSWDLPALPDAPRLAELMDEFRKRCGAAQGRGV